MEPAGETRRVFQMDDVLKMCHQEVLINVGKRYVAELPDGRIVMGQSKEQCARNYMMETSNA
jgi:hypothetical protein